MSALPPCRFCGELPGTPFDIGYVGHHCKARADGGAGLWMHPDDWRALMAPALPPTVRFCKRCHALATDEHWDEGICMAAWTPLSHSDDRNEHSAVSWAYRQGKQDASPALPPTVTAVLDACEARQVAWEVFILDRLSDTLDDRYKNAFEVEEVAVRRWRSAGRPGLAPRDAEKKEE
jgi:hypothetical protein